MSTEVKNLWSLDKDPAIKAVLILLQHEIGPNQFMLMDLDKLNEKAVRIINRKSPTQLSAYVYSYAQGEGRYGLDLEFPYLIETRAYDQILQLNDLTMEEVVEKIKEHLELV